MKLGGWNSARPGPGQAVQFVLKEEVISALSAVSLAGVRPLPWPAALR